MLCYAIKGKGSQVLCSLQSMHPLTFPFWHSHQKQSEKHLIKENTSTGSNQNRFSQTQGFAFNSTFATKKERVSEIQAPTSYLPHTKQSINHISIKEKKATLSLLGGGRNRNVGLAGEREDGTFGGREDAVGLLLLQWLVVAAAQDLLLSANCFKASLSRESNCSELNSQSSIFLVRNSPFSS